MTILADSCCDLSPELLKKTQAKIAPLTITIDDTHYVDDGTVDIPPYLAAMKASKNPVRSACPSPDLYAEDIRATEMDNLVKNGRISKTVALLANVLSIRLLMSDDGHGAIKNISKARGIKGALGQMVETCRKHTEGLAAASQRLVISYCNCPERARQVRDMIREKCPAIGEIIMTPTSALSSMYANDGGIVIAY